MNFIENENFCLGAENTGAELRSFVDKRDKYEYLWQGEEPWKSCSPLLFPIVGRLKDDTYYIKEQKYSLEKHGFARKLPFEMEANNGTSMTFLLKETDETLKKYPYPFELRVHFELRENGFIMEHRVKNTGREQMYFSLGAHPGFQCEMGDRIIMDEKEVSHAFQLDENKLRGKDTLPVFENTDELIITPNVFENDALIFDGLNSKGATLIRANKKNLHVDFGGAPCLGLWARPGANYVCIEPWYGIDDRFDAAHDFTKKEHIQSLNPQKEFIFTVTVTV